MIRNLLAIIGLAAVAIATALGLQAAGYIGEFDDYGDPPPRVRVSYVGLDLTTPEGVRTLEGRINRAINEVCPREEGVVALYARRAERRCREDAIAGVEPQVHAAIAAAEARARRVEPIDDDPYPQLPPPRPLPVDPPEADLPPPLVEHRPPPPPARLVRRTVTTTTVTTTRGAPPPAIVARPVVKKVTIARKAHPASAWSAVHKPATTRPARFAPYAKRPEVPGSWLPPAAWRAIDRATLRALATGRLTRWVVAGREGYVTVSAARWIGGCKCRNVRAVKYADGRQIVVAEGLRCLDRGRLVARGG